MTALTQSQIQSLPDILSTDRFTVNFGSVPGYGDCYDVLTFKCMDVFIPGSLNERFEIPLGPVYRSFRGKKNFPRTMTLTFTESVDLSTLTVIRGWLEYIAGTQSGNSQDYLPGYSVVAQVVAYDTTGAPADIIYLVNCFPYDLQDIQFSTQQTQFTQVQVAFSYDYATYDTTAIT